MKIKNKRKKVLYTLIILVVALILFRIYLPTLVLNYTNKTLQEIPDYTGSIDDIEICLLKGEYSLINTRITKKDATGDKPLLFCPKIDLSVQWSALKEMRIVGEIDVYDPAVNFIFVKADANAAGSQTGENVDWTQPINDLMPLKINRFTIHNGKVHYNDPAQDPPIDIYINELNCEGTNFSNAQDMEHPLPSKIIATASSIGGGQMYLTMRINPLKQIPDFDYEFKFEGVKLNSLNTFTDAYAALDFDQGNLDLYSEMSVKNGNIEGYFKPVMTNIDLINFKEDIRNPLKLIWESFASLILEIFENQGKDQFATRVPIKGNFDNPETSIWPALGAILKNAFIQAFKKQVDDSIEFENVESKPE